MDAAQFPTRVCTITVLIRAFILANWATITGVPTCSRSHSWMESEIDIVSNARRQVCVQQLGTEFFAEWSVRSIREIVNRLRCRCLCSCTTSRQEDRQSHNNGNTCN